MGTKSGLRDVEPIVLSEAHQRILSWFFAFPDVDISLTELCKKTHTAKTVAKGIVLSLEKQGFLRRRSAGRAWLISTVKGHEYFSTKKVAANLALVYESGIIKIVRERFPSVKAIILFGSYRNGDDVPESDLDIAAEVAGNQPLEIIEFGTLPHFGYRSNIKVNLHVFSRKSIDTNVFSNIANGIVLEGFLEVRS